MRSFGDAWNEITEKNMRGVMRGVWEPLLKRKELPIDLKIDEVIEEVVNLATDVGFDMTAEEVQESLTFDDREMSNEDLFEIAQCRAFEAKASDEIQIPENPLRLSYL